MPIVVQKIKPFASYSSAGDYIFRKFSPTVDSARAYFQRKYDSFRLYSDNKEYVFLYRIEKINTKKTNTKKKQVSAQGFQVVKRKVVREKEVKLHVYKFLRKNVVACHQFNNHFTVTLKV